MNEGQPIADDQTGQVTKATIARVRLWVAGTVLAGFLPAAWGLADWLAVSADVDKLKADRDRDRAEIHRLSAEVETQRRQHDALSDFVWRVARSRTSHTRPDPVLDAPPDPTETTK